jgi:hypothetical protein
MGTDRKMMALQFLEKKQKRCFNGDFLSAARCKVDCISGYIINKMLNVVSKQKRGAYRHHRQHHLFPAHAQRQPPKAAKGQYIS